MKPNLSSLRLAAAARLSTTLRGSIPTQWAARCCCSLSPPVVSSQLNKESDYTSIFSSSLQQGRYITTGLKAEGTAEDADTESKRAPSNAKTLVKQLRERTAVSVGLCKRALEESNWDEEEAVVYLRKSGIARAAKAAGREAREGVIAVSISSDEAQCTAVMLNCETDFVQKNPKFVAFSRALAEHCRSTLQPDDITPSLGARESALIEQLKSSRPSYNLSSCVQRDSTAPANSVNELLADLTTQFGEKVEVSAVECMGSDASSCIGVYVHNEATPGVGVGRAAAMVELRWDLSSTSATPATVLRERLSKFARLMAMQVVASSPKFVDLNSIPSSTVEEERSIAEETSKAAAAAGTKGAAEPKDSSASETKETMPSKIAAQRMQRYLQEQCLVFQEFLMIKQLYNDVLSDIQAETATQSTGSRSSSKTNNQPITVADALQLVGKTLGCNLTVSRMRLITVGSQ